MRLPSRPLWLRVAGWGLGLVAMAAVVWFAGRQVDLAVLRSVSPGVLAAMAGLVAGNLVLSGLLFASVQRAFPSDRPVGAGTMILLVAGSALLNYLPAIRAGLLGRAAYLKKTHGVALRDSAWTLLVVTALTAGVFATVAGPWLILRLATPDGQTAHGLAWFVCIPATVALVPGLRFALEGLFSRTATPSGPASSIRSMLTVATWVALRTADLLVATGRLWLAFGALGSPLGFAEALVLSAASLLIRLIGLTPNGLGLSEWAVAALAAALTPAESGVAAAAALLDRALEIVVVIVAGGASIGYLTRTARRPRENSST